MATPARRFDQNLEALGVLKRLAAEGRRATPAEQAVLARYSGFGDSAFEQAFRTWGSREPAWSRRGDRLRELVTPAEFRSIENSRTNAFYTTPEVITAIWAGLERLGLGGVPAPRILEPSAGSGRFLGLQPRDLAARSRRSAVELDTLSGRILRQVYQQADVQVVGFQDAILGAGRFDAAVTNVPFSEVGVVDKAFMQSGRRWLQKPLHNYFFAKTLDHLRPGGVLAFVTTHFTLDAPTQGRFREYLADRADLLGAIRLPSNAFPDTEVVTDIIFLRKRLETDPPGSRAWTGTVEKAEKIDQHPYERRYQVNAYYEANQGMVLGSHSTKGSMYRAGEYTVVGSGPLGPKLRAAIERMPQGVIVPRDVALDEAAPRLVPPNIANDLKEGAYVLQKGALLVRRGQGLERPAFASARDDARVRGMLGVRDAARDVLARQLEGAGPAAITQSQQALGRAYGDFVRAHGPLNSQANRRLMRADPDGHFLRALERWGPEAAARTKGGVSDADLAALKTPLFTETVIRQAVPVESADSPKDAMLVVLNERGRLDFDRMAQLTGQTPEALQADLVSQGLVYENPAGDWEASDAYLSGNVKQKLAEALHAATDNPRFERNAEALRAVQPDDIPPSEIAVRLGTQWVPATDITRFVNELLGAQSYGYGRAGDYFTYLPQTAEWVASAEPLVNRAKNLNEWGTERAPAFDIIAKLLNGQQPKVYDPDPADPNKRVQNTAETLAAQEKAEAIGAEFREWAWRGPERAARLHRYYNDTFNVFRLRRYDGAHLQLAGSNPAITLRAHQRDAIWRILQDGTTLLAHEVGFGKTFTMVGAAMEGRRLGLVKKNLIVVPKPLVEQFAADFRRLYPNASILLPDGADFDVANRATFMSRIATGDWDAVIVSMQQFEKLPLRRETAERYFQEQIAEYADLLREMEEADRGAKRTRSHKQLTKAKQRLETRLKATQAKLDARQDTTIHYEDLGIDALFVDEADAYKNLPFVTRRDRVKGLPNPTENQRSSDLLMKSRLMLERNGGRGLVFSTGTPVSNTIAEVWTMMRYLMPGQLRDMGMANFDGWAQQFGDETTALEQTVTGAYRPTTRFARFVNVPELSSLFQQVADIRVAAEQPELAKFRPRLVGPEQDGKRLTIVSPASDELTAIMTELADRAESLGGKDPRDDNMLKIAFEARLAALDQRLWDKELPEFIANKATLAADEIAAVWRDTEADHGAQVVFLDLSTPKARDPQPARPAGAEDETLELAAADADASVEALTGDEARLQADVYNDLLAKLVRRGVPAEQIKFAHEANTDDRRSALYDDVREGRVRVLIGSTSKIGAGVNIQRRLAALHHLDVPWRPRDLKQREGRILRQGNEVYGPKLDQRQNVTDPGRGVRIYQYVSELPAFDGYMWQGIETKGRAIDAVMRRVVTARTVQDADEITMTAAEVRGLASGNPDVMKRVHLQADITKLQALRATHLDRQLQARAKLAALPEALQADRARLAASQDDLRLATRAGDTFGLKVGGSSFAKRPEAGEALAKALAGAMGAADWLDAGPRALGSFKGFTLTAAPARGGVRLALKNPTRADDVDHGFSIAQADITPQGLVTRIENLLKDLPQQLTSLRNRIGYNERDLETWREQAGKPFPHEERLGRMARQLHVIERRLQGEQVDDVDADVEPPAVAAEAPPVPTEPAGPTVTPPDQAVVAAQAPATAGPPLAREAPPPLPKLAPTAGLAEIRAYRRELARRLPAELQRKIVRQTAEGLSANDIVRGLAEAEMREIYRYNFGLAQNAVDAVLELHGAPPNPHGAMTFGTEDVQREAERAFEQWRTDALARDTQPAEHEAPPTDTAEAAPVGAPEVPPTAATAAVGPDQGARPPADANLPDWLRDDAPPPRADVPEAAPEPAPAEATARRRREPGPVAGTPAEARGRERRPARPRPTREQVKDRIRELLADTDGYIAESVLRRVVTRLPDPEAAAAAFDDALGEMLDDGTIRPSRDGFEMPEQAKPKERVRGAVRQAGDEGDGSEALQQASRLPPAEYRDAIEELLAEGAIEPLALPNGGRGWRLARAEAETEAAEPPALTPAAGGAGAPPAEPPPPTAGAAPEPPDEPAPPPAAVSGPGGPGDLPALSDEDITHVVGYGYTRGLDPNGAAAGLLRRLAVRYREGYRVPADFPTIEEVGEKLGITPESAVESALGRLPEEEAARVRVLRTLVAKIVHDFEAQQRALAADADLSTEDYLAQLERLQAMAELAHADVFRATRRAARSAGLALREFQWAPLAAEAGRLYQELHGRAGTLGRAADALGRLSENGKLQPDDARELRTAAETLDRLAENGQLSDRPPGLRAVMERMPGIGEDDLAPPGPPEPEMMAAGGDLADPSDVTSRAERRPTEQARLETELGKLNRAQAEARAAGDHAAVNRLETQRQRVLGRLQDIITRQVQKRLEPKPPQQRTAEQLADLAAREGGRRASSVIRGRVTDEMTNYTRFQAALDKAFVRAFTRAELQARADDLRRLIDLGLDLRVIPGMAEEVRALERELREFGALGEERARHLKKLLWDSGLRRLFGQLDEAELDQAHALLRSIDPANPRTLIETIKFLRKASGAQRFNEFTVVNMLSSWRTWGLSGVNMLSNMVQGGRTVAWDIPVMTALDLASSGLTGREREMFARQWPAAVKGMLGGMHVGAQMAAQVWWRGASDEQLSRALTLADLRSLHRETLSELPGALGWAGRLLHMLSTRPLSAGDTLIGHLIYSGQVGSLVYQKAEKQWRALPKRERDRTSVDELASRIRANLWDHDDIITRAGQVAEYSLYRDKLPRLLQDLAQLRYPTAGASKGTQALAILTHQVFPFIVTPYNWLKQNVMLSAPGVVANAVRFGTNREDVPKQLKIGADLVLGAAVTLLGLAWMAGGNLSGDGPIEESDRRMLPPGWQPRSYRVWNWRTQTHEWHSYDGMPWTVALATVANAGDAYFYMNKKGKADPSNFPLYLLTAAGFMTRGGLSAIMSQPMIRSANDIVEDLGDPRKSLERTGTNVLTRVIPAGGLVSFLAQLGDDVQRKATTVPERVAERLPGLRATVPERQDVLGRPLRNDQTGLGGFIPRWGVERDDPVIRAYRRKGMAIPEPPKELNVDRGVDVPLTAAEQREFLRLRGEIITRAFYSSGADRVDEATLRSILAASYDGAKQQLLARLGGAEINRRVRQPAGVR